MEEKTVKAKSQSDAAWYCRKKSEEEERYMDLFFAFCRQFDVHWSSATEQEQEFIYELIRVTMEREQAVKTGLDPNAVVRPCFSA